jgi:glutathione peroxidase
VARGGYHVEFRSPEAKGRQVTVYDFRIKTIDGVEVSLSDYKGQVLLMVNVASRCGFTPQYKGLEELYRKYHDRGLAILGFPCNQFGSQEPGSASEIKTFCETNYNITFPLFSKIDVNGQNAHPLYEFLKGVKRGIFGTRNIKWNFTKFLVDRKGNPIKRYSPRVKPETLTGDIQRLL